MTETERAARVALALVPGIGSARLHSLLQACHSALGAFSAPYAFLCSVPHMSPAAATAVKAGSPDEGRRVLAQVERAGGRTLLAGEADYPRLLDDIAEPPPVLFALGDVGALTLPAAAVVGSRDHTDYGRDVARQVAWAASAAGIAVVSGMARGLDAVAHRAALDAGGTTIGVLGNGLGVVYPAANRALYQAVAERGLLLSEFPPGERPHAGSFPRRNRIISGLARVTVVVEAGEGSGALITADKALEQGREVMAVPGPITSPQSVGSNRLIHDGAAPLLEMRDLLEHYPDAVPPARAVPHPPPEGGLPPLPASLEGQERNVAELLGGGALALDELVARSGCPARELLAVLCSLEIAGVVEQTTGRVFRRAR